MYRQSGRSGDDPQNTEIIKPDPKFRQADGPFAKCGLLRQTYDAQTHTRFGSSLNRSDDLDFGDSLCVV